jgi:hypothetical protein
VRRLGLDHGEFLVDFDVVEHRPGQQMRDPLTHVVFGQNDVVGPDPAQNVAVLAADRLGPDVEPPSSARSEVVRMLANAELAGQAGVPSGRRAGSRSSEGRPP